MRLDPSRLPAGLVADTSNRAGAGIRISLDRDLLQPPPRPAAIDCGSRLDDRSPIAGLEYAVVDVETTGGSFSSGHRVTEIAVYRVSRTGTVIDECRTLVNPQRPIPPFVTSLTSISWEMVRDAPRFGELAGELQRVLQDAVFVAHNAAFDWRFVGAELALAGVPLAGRTLCTVQLARRLVPELRNRSLDSVCWFFHVHNYARHRAWGDALATTQVLRRLLDRAEDRSARSLGDLQQLVRQRAARRGGRRRVHALPEDA